MSATNRGLIALLVVAAGGCGPSRAERCEEAREKAVAAVAAYRDNLAPAVKKAREASRTLLETELGLVETWRTMASCQAFRELGLYKRVQPYPNLTKLTPIGSVTSTLDLCSDLKDAEGVSEATVAELETSCAKLEANRARFDAEIPVARRRKGRAWTAAQRTYLDSLSGAWCGLVGVQKKAISQYETAMKAKLAAHDEQAEHETLARSSALLSALGSGEKGELGDLGDDPTFPTREVQAAWSECELE